ncbi:MAG: VWA domain-containing protein [Pyrinomonadaceae bacterium]
MKKIHIIVLFLLVMSSFAFGQSGRKATATPTPQAARQDDATQYSESKPKTSRTARIAERFPGIGSGANIKPEAPKIYAPATGNAKDDGDTLKVETNLITIPVSVFDRNGLYIPGLRQTEFKIFEDGKEQEIAYFGTTDKPFTVALMIDTSPSTAYRIDEIRRAATAFVDMLEPQDSVVVIEFNGGVKVRTEATADRQKIYKAISKANFGDGTSLYTAVDEALRKQLGKVTGRKAVVLFTDGVDTTSRKNTYDTTLSYAEESDTLIFPIYYNTFFENRSRQTSPFPDIFGTPTFTRGASAEEYALGKKYLEDLADATGGRIFRPEATPGGLTAAFEGIAEELRRQYNIGYVPTDEGKPGQRKQIKIRVDRPNLVIRARDSYIVGTAVTAPEPPKTDK